MNFICPISNKLIKDPVSAPGGSLCFERAALVHWIERHGTNPLNLEKMTLQDIQSNPQQKLYIETEILGSQQQSKSSCDNKDVSDN
jgi:hypothetical protein